MRASVIRVDSPTEAVKSNAVAEPTAGPAQGNATPRSPLSEITNGNVANGASPSSEPRRLMSTPLPGSLRRVSGDIANRFVADSPAQAQTPSENESPWSAVGHATTSGKSGRVIEKLMGENDRLKRDLDLSILKTQELERNIQAIAPQLEALQAENSNLTHTRDVDGSLLSRRDRKIEALKEELAAEKVRREASETMVRKVVSEKDHAVEKARRDVLMAQEEAKHSTVHAQIMEQSHKQLSKEYKTRAETWRKDIVMIEEDRRHNKEKLSQLELVADSMRSELERSRKLQTEYSEVFETYKTATERWQKDINELAIAETQRSSTLSDEMEAVVNKMRWVMANNERLSETKTKQGS